MICYELKEMKRLPDNCLDCDVHLCKLPLKQNKYEPEIKKQYKKKRHEKCPLIEINEKELACQI